MEHFALKYLRKDRLPHMFCTGCGIGICINCFCKALDDLNLDLDKTVLVSGIGCSSRVPGYFYLDSLHTTHGRALAFATGIKVANPDLNVIVFTGDGDLAAIGGNHFIHACRRNIDLTVICINNNIYGMTGGQFSPTTPKGFRATTAPYGNVENNFDLCKLAEAAGASYVARWTTAHPFQLVRSIKKGIKKKGLAFIEVVSQCYTYFGRLNKFKSNVDLLNWIKNNSIPINKAKNMENLEGKIIVGEFLDIEKPEYTEEVYKLIEREKQ
ncbi:2-oxoacid:ferredoxin oxidoreductase subunit beta [Methanocaldococcus sp.]